MNDWASRVSAASLAAGEPRRLRVSGAPEGYDALLVADAARAAGALWVHVARDDARAQAMGEALNFFAPDIPVLRLPAWDCLPYDRVSPRPEIAAERMTALAALSSDRLSGPRILVTTVNAALQRVPPRSSIADAHFDARVGNSLDLEALTRFLTRNGYVRASMVTEPGDYAVRGGIVDLFPPGAEEPIRVDLFGDMLDAVRTFDPETQRSTGQLRELALVPVSEIPMDEEARQRFRSGYVKAFGGIAGDDPLYEAVSAGRKHQGMEHWLPLFHERLETLFDYAPGAPMSLDALAEDAREARLSMINDHYEARAEDEGRHTGAEAFQAPAYKPLPPDALYLTADEWDRALEARPVRSFSPFREAPGPGVLDTGAKQGRSFAPERATEGTNVFDALAGHVRALLKSGTRTFIACWTEGSADRMAGVLSDHGLEHVARPGNFAEAAALKKDRLGIIVLGLEQGFEAGVEDGTAPGGLAILSEQDILGDRLIRGRKKTRKGANFISEASSLLQGDLVVHVDHGIGRYEGLQTLEVMGAPHDCLTLIYHGGDKLYLPVENIELLSRYGSADEDAHLDRLGGSAWQARKAKLKERIREIADKLIKVAAERELRDAPKFDAAHGLYEEFSARFPYEETEDQARAIDDVMGDLARGRPMDRLICGDVGFGKTEVALRSAFVAAMSGQQVAVVVPTTLLARQHFKTFQERFQGWPLTIRQLSRLTTAKDAAETRAGLTEGTVDVVIGTHALLGKRIAFKNLGLLVIDEEQHFGVQHKERLKDLRSNVHVLTLTATPIPRTLQLAMTGIRDLSIIATPPVDRLAVRTYVTPFDPVVVREALLRELYRGGQSFYVCPRISDLPDAAEFLREEVPEVKFVTAHGRMASGELEEVMNAFYDRQYDVLVSTTIVESGLDIPTANTLVVHRADMFGLAQLYQIRGRIGRSKARAYAYLTVPPRRQLTAGAEQRLQVLQSLDTLGAGFTLASHDLDIRGAGNLLGEEQSGQVKEVGVELYQAMLEEAVSTLRSGDLSVEMQDQWSPQINVGTAVLIPEHYVPDLTVRLALYRRLAELEEPEEIEGFAAELTDRFGALPEEAEILLKIVAIKRLCRRANVEKVDAGPKGITLQFRKNEFPNPGGLIEMLAAGAAGLKLKQDQRVVQVGDFETADARLKGVHKILDKLARVAEAGEKAA